MALTPEQREARRLAQQRYQTSPKGKAAARRYRAEAKMRKNETAEQREERLAAARAAYALSPEIRQRAADANAKYLAGPLGDAARRRRAAYAREDELWGGPEARPPYRPPMALTREEYDAMIAEREARRNLFGPPVYGHP